VQGKDGVNPMTLWALPCGMDKGAGKRLHQKMSLVAPTGTTGFLGFFDLRP
jgi:hypothetical protein